mmetsp:Transcript_11423/g.26509  ORF Transcript_11423/g.26509 Transcript_11423/m.26509 type:complete len:314 (+) Transcript_11423:28-969(+)
MTEPGGESTKMEVEKPQTEEKKPTTDGEPSASEENASKYPDMQLAQKIHRLRVLSSATPLLDIDDAGALGIPKDLNKLVMEEVAGENVENPSLYRQLKTSLHWDGGLSEEQLAVMDEKHKKTLEELEKKVEEAKESAGDMEVLGSRFEVARFAAKSLGKDEALEAYDKLLALPKLSSGKTIDALMESSRVASFHGDTRKNGVLIDRATKLAQEGGDWDRRNRLKVYKALSKMLLRDIKVAANLLIDCIATFSCNELCSYSDFVVYAILTNILHLPRPDLKEKIIDGPEILSVSKDIPTVVSVCEILCKSLHCS